MYIILKIEKKIFESQNSIAPTIIIIATFQYDYHILDIIYQPSQFCLLTLTTSLLCCSIIINTIIVVVIIK